MAYAEARANIALVKYWGKIDTGHNVPAGSSVSMTTDILVTRTRVTPEPSLQHDELWINEVPMEGLALERASRHVDRVLQRTKQSPRVRIESHNNFPTAAGLASSASGFAALTLATAAIGKKFYTQQQLAVWARQSSASAARSMLGGWVSLPAGRPDRPISSVPTQILPEDAWPEMRLVLALADPSPKEVSSTQGMLHTMQTSPYYQAFIRSTKKDAPEAISAIERRDLETLGAVTERSALRMHAAALAAAPGLVYWRGATVEALHRLRSLRKQGIAAWFTCDAGSHPKVLTTANCVDAVCAALADLPGITNTLVAKPGPKATLLQDA